MNSEEILEGNKLIAEFMGNTVYPATWNENKKEWVYDKKWKGEGCDYEPFQLKYNSSWDWLMPVVEKMIELATDFEVKNWLINITIEISNSKQYAISTMDYLKTIDASMIGSYYFAVVEFIKWYNNNSTTLKTTQP